MDAIHFRQKAANAREMAQSGDDIRLSRMLLEVALDFDAEAEAIEAWDAKGGSNPGCQYLMEAYGATLRPTFSHPDHTDTDAAPVQIINLSIGGVKFYTDLHLKPGSQMTLELSRHALRLDGTIVSAGVTQAAMIFDSLSSADPGLTRLLQPERMDA